MPAAAISRASRSRTTFPETAVSSLARLAWVALGTLALMSGPALAEAPAFVRGEVTRVADGDTLLVQLASGPIRVRLHGVDAPESDQPGGVQARQALARLVQGKQVELEPIEQDRYQRMVANVRLGELDINRVLVVQGHAWAYRRYLGREEAGYCRDEALARQAHRGLWNLKMASATEQLSMEQTSQRRVPSAQQDQGVQALLARSAARQSMDADGATAGSPRIIAPWEWRQRKQLATLTDYADETEAGCVAALGRR